MGFVLSDRDPGLIDLAVAHGVVQCLLDDSVERGFDIRPEPMRLSASLVGKADLELHFRTATARAVDEVLDRWPDANVVKGRWSKVGLSTRGVFQSRDRAA